MELIPQTKKGKLSNSFAYASISCSLSFWLAYVLGYLQTAAHLDVSILRWIDTLPGWKWALFEAFALLLAIVATALGSKLWRIALPVALLMFLLIMYVMAT